MTPSSHLDSIQFSRIRIRYPLGTRRELLKYETQEAGAGAAGDTPRQEGNEARNSNLGEDECERFEQMANNNQHNDSCATGAACVGCGIIQAPNVACGSQLVAGRRREVQGP